MIQTNDWKVTEMKIICSKKMKGLKIVVIDIQRPVSQQIVDNNFEKIINLGREILK